jgi:ribonuclease E
MKKEMLINVLQPEECRIAIVEDGVLEELYVERTTQESYVGNIYKGRIVNIEPSIQAAFVDFGVGRNGFLHVSDVDPQYFRKDKDDSGKSVPARSNGDDDDEDDEAPDRRGRRGFRRPVQKPPIQEIFRRGADVLVQVIKEGIGNKGPTLSTYISIPGRYLVLMPGLNRIGVSRKIEDEQQRRALRQIVDELEPPPGLGFIVRTAGIDRNKKELSADLAYLTRLWKVVVRRINKSRVPADIYQESDMVTRTIRDIFNADIDTVWIDERGAHERAVEFCEVVMPRYAGRLKLHEEQTPLFHKYGIDAEIARIQQRTVPLPRGGSIVIDQAEALVAIDVNSGNFRADDDAEETAYQINLAAAKEIARQLRLRDLGGVIVNDFIDMRDERHSRDVERAMREAVRRDRARTKVLRMSQFGIIEMTRQRVRPSLQRAVYERCPACSGSGHVKTVESMAIDAMRLVQLAAHRPEIARFTITVHAPVANYLNNRKRKELVQLEQEQGKVITIRGSDAVLPEHLAIECWDTNGAECKLPPSEPPRVAAPERPAGPSRGAAGPDGRRAHERAKDGHGRGGSRGRGRRGRRGGRRSNRPGASNGDASVAQPAGEPAPPGESNCAPLGTPMENSPVTDVELPPSHDRGPDAPNPNEWETN